MKTRTDFTALKQEIQKALTDLSGKLSIREQQHLASDIAKPHARHLTKGVIQLAKLYVEQHDYNKALHLLQVAKSSPLKDERYHRLFGNSTCAMKIQAYEERIKEEKIKSGKPQTKTNVISVTSLPKPVPYRAPAPSSGNTSNMLRIMAEEAYLQQQFLMIQDDCTPGQSDLRHNSCHQVGHHGNHHNDTNSHTHPTSHDTGAFYGHSSFFSEPSHHHNHPTYGYSHHNDMTSHAHHNISHDTGSSYGHSSFHDTSAHHDTSSFSHQDTSSYNPDMSSGFGFN